MKWETLWRVNCRLWTGGNVGCVSQERSCEWVLKECCTSPHAFGVLVHKDGNRGRLQFRVEDGDTSCALFLESL